MLHFDTLGGSPRNPASPYSCVCLHGDRKPAERKDNLEAFKKGKVKFLICTDVAARGIDINGLPFSKFLKTLPLPVCTKFLFIFVAETLFLPILSLVINVTLPDDKSNYVHRIGRVGRAERMGLAVSLVSSVPEKVWFHGEWCPSRGRNCSNSRLTAEGGCCIWYNEPQVRFSSSSKSILHLDFNF